MDKVQETIFAARRLLNESRQRQMTLQLAKRDPQKYRNGLNSLQYRRILRPK